MRAMQLLRRPLVWMIAAEAIVVSILLGAAWHFYESYRRSPAATPPAVAKAPAVRATVTVASPRATPPSPARTPKPPSAAPARPGIGLPFDIQALNGDAADWERKEERVAMALTGALRVYVEAVVVPAVERAERVRPATSPATTQSPAAIRNTP